MARRLGGRRGRLGPRAEGWDADRIEDLATELEKDSSPARPGPFGATSILLDNGGVHQAPGRMLEG